MSKETERGGISRRNLIKGAGVVGAASLVAGLMGCASPSQPSAGEAGGEPGSASGAQGSTGGSGPFDRNPQDESFADQSSDCAALFEPITIGGKQARNRIMKSAAGTYTYDLSYTPVLEGYYADIARGGAGIVMVESLTWIIEDENTLTPLVEAIHAGGALAGMQVWGLWFNSSSEKNATSPLEQARVDIMPRGMMSVEDIHAFQDDMVAQAKMFQGNGFDILEINAGCDHTFASFLSRHLNCQRDDEYGPQSLENRARIITELIGRIKSECPGLAVQVLFNCVEENVEEMGDSELCMKPEEAVEFAKLFEAAGADSLQVRTAVFGNHAAGFFPDLMHIGAHGNTGVGTQVDYATHMAGIIDGAHEGVAAFADLCAMVKAAVSIPVGFVGDVDPRLAPATVNSAVADGKADFVVMNRPLMVDPELPNKIQAGDFEGIRPCNKCVCCFQSVVNPAGIGFCRANPAMYRAYSEEMPEGPEPLPADTVKKVLVAGGGPAGMEAAITAAKRGHQVKLFEKGGSLGGLVPFAAMVKGPHERLADYLAYQQHMLETLGVEVVTGTEVNADLVASEAPDVVISAIGGVVPETSVEVVEASKAVAFNDAMAVDLGSSVAIVGGSLRATDFANYLVNMGVKVHIVQEGAPENLAAAQAPWSRAVILSWIKSQGCVVHSGATDISVTAEGVEFTTDLGLRRTVKVDSVVLCDDLAPNGALAGLPGVEVITVGDAAAPAAIIDAVRDAHLAARGL